MKIRNFTVGFSPKTLLLLIPAALAFLALWANFRYPSDAGIYENFRKDSAPQERRTITRKICDSPFSVTGKSDDKSSSLTDELTAAGHCVPYPYSRAAGIVRFASGNVGTWIDERRSILIKGGQTLDISLSVPAGGRFEFSEILCSKSRDSRVITVTASDGKVLLSDEISPYDRASYNAAQKRPDPAFPELISASGWQNRSIDLSSFEGKTVRLSITMKKTSGEGDTLFIGEPVVTSNTAPKKYNVIHILFDAMSQKYMGIYNHSSSLTPNIDRAKDDFIIFDGMHSTGTKTRISVGSFLTSKLPPSTGHGYNFNVISDDEKRIFYNNGSITTIPRVLSSNGYFTMQVGNCGFTNPVLPTAIDYGFDESYEFQTIPYDSTGITYNFMKRIRENGNRPFYLYAHLNTTHKPRITPLSNYLKGYLTMPSHSWRPNVTGSTSYADDLFGEMISFLKKEGLWDNTIVIVTSDHGTLFEAENYGRNNLLEDFIRIPFMIHIPDSLKKESGISGDRVTAATSMLNLAPTITDLTGMGSIGNFAGKSLRPMMSSVSRVTRPEHLIYAYDTFGISLIMDGRFKYTLNEYDSELEDAYRTHRPYFFGNGPADPAELLVDLNHDPLEKKNLISALRKTANDGRRALLDSPSQPHVGVFTVLPHVKETVTISVNTDSEIAYVEIADMKKDDKITVCGSHAEITLSPAGTFRSAAVRTYRDFPKIGYTAFVGTNRIPKERIVCGEYLLGLADNPGAISADPLDYSIETIRLYPQKGYGRFTTKPYLHVARMDIRRWQKETMAKSGSGADTNMKEVLKSWGYIQ
jgi:arylsulfatase A-like enzyme